MATNSLVVTLVPNAKLPKKAFAMGRLDVIGAMRKLKKDSVFDIARGAKKKCIRQVAEYSAESYRRRHQEWMLVRDQAKSTFDFLGKRFTHSQLYQWLNGQYATFFYQAYDATLSLCLAAQANGQYELCDYATTFINPGAGADETATFRKKSKALHRRSL